MKIIHIHISIGKSTLGNLLLGYPYGKTDKMFKVGTGARSETEKCQFGTGCLEDGRELIVVDTPGFLDTRKRTEKEKEKLAKEIGKSLQVAYPGPHIFIIVMEFEKMIEARFSALKEMEKIFPNLWNYAMFAFIRKLCFM